MPEISMRRTSPHPVSLLLAGIAALATLPLPAADWPQYRGANADGVVQAELSPTAWPAAGLTKAWQVPLGGGYSGLSAVKDRLYTQFSNDKDELLAAFDTKTGKEVWRLRLDAVRRDQFGDGPRATPTIDGNVAYVVSALGRLYAVDRTTGKAIWQHDLQKEYGLVVPTWGVSASPVVVGNLLVHNVGGRADHALMAFDKATGKVAWHADSGIAGYSLPLPITVHGVAMIVFFTGKKIVAVEPKAGGKLWELPWETAYDVNAATPIFIAPDQLFLASGYDTGAVLLKIKAAAGKASFEELWRSRAMKATFSSPVYHEGYFYGFDNKALKCLDARTGKDVWRKTGFGHGSLFLMDGHLVVLGENGRLALAEATPQAYVEKAAMDVAEGKHWTVPTYHDGYLYIRNEESLFAFKMS
jgi:outer membrane protein assembly factor BamB